MGVFMDFLTANWHLFLIAAVSGCMLFLPLFKGRTLGGDASLALGASAMVQLLNRSKAQVIDLRKTEDFAGGHVAKASQMELKNLEQQLPGIVRKKTTPVIFICYRGVTAARAAAQAKALGYEESRYLEGGMPAWVEAKMPVEKTA